jgi:hypothetical protein
VPAAHEFAQLSTLHSLQEVRIDWQSSFLGAAALEDMAAAFQVLPLTSVTWEHAGIPAAVVQQLGNLQGLTALYLSTIVSAPTSQAVRRLRSTLRTRGHVSRTV